MMKLLVVDDDLELNEILTFTLQRAGFQVLSAYDGVSALQLWRDEQPDLILLDVNMPRLDGFGVLRQVRRETSTPVILLTVRDEEEDIVQGLEAGADDYISKPFSPRQLVARVRAVLRRSGRRPGEIDNVSRFESEGAFVLDTEQRTVAIAGAEVVRLTTLEFRLLRYLMQNREHVLTPNQIIAQVWGDPEAADRAALKQLVRRLRRKIEANPSAPRYLRTVPGAGYLLSVGTGGDALVSPAQPS